MFDDLKKIEGKTIQSVTVKDEWNAEAMITFTDGTTLKIKFSDDPWGSSWCDVEYKDKEPA